MFTVGRHQEGMTLNGYEFLLDKDTNIRQFKTIKDAVLFMLEQGAEPEDFGYAYFIGTEDKPDQWTPEVYGFTDQPETCRKDGARADILYEGKDADDQAFMLCQCPQCGALYFLVDSELVN